MPVSEKRPRDNSSLETAHKLHPLKRRKLDQLSSKSGVFLAMYFTNTCMDPNPCAAHQMFVKYIFSLYHALHSVSSTFVCATIRSTISFI